MEALPPNLHKPFEKGLTLNFIFNRAVARLVMGQGAESLAGVQGTASPHSLSTPKNHPTKMGSRQSLPHSRRSGYEGSDAMKKTDWKQEAASLFFGQGKSLVEIADLTGVSRKTLSFYLQTLPGYTAERERRKQENRRKRKEYQREWDRKNRRYTTVNAETMRREHELAVLILSREKY